MKKLLLLVSLIPLASFAQQDYNPFEAIGKKVTVVTLSNGRYKETYDGDTVKRIGNVMFDIRTNKIVKFLEENDTTTYEFRKGGDLSTRWLSIDPLAAKYPYLSPYVFVANNPILFIDPDGKEIILHGSNDFKTKTLAALQKLTSNKIILDANNKVVIVSGLSSPNKNKPYGTDLINQLVTSENVIDIYFNDKNITIAKSAENATNGIGTGSMIFLNDNSEEAPLNIKGKAEISSYEINAGHELIHSLHNDKGKNDPSQSMFLDPDNPTNRLSNEEVNTRKEENILSSEQNQTLRAVPSLDIKMKDNVDNTELKLD